ncbi:MAG: GNAT family N-acetyltransferase [Deltaproteobacteria bacterium]|nr:GNAT family N-acetyltransferase [Deltaproteobacteria bacterium]
MALSFFERMEDVSVDEWDGVLSRSFRPSPFLSPRFLLPWAEAFAPDRPKRIARWERKGQVEGFLFLCRRENTGGWELLGGEQVSDSLGPVVASGQEGTFWAELLRSAGDLLSEGPLCLPNLVEGSPALSLLPGICRDQGFSFDLAELDRSPYISLPRTFEDYLGGLGKKERHELRRKLRRAAEAEPGLSFRVTGTPEELSRDFPSFVALHRMSTPAKRRFMDDRMERFFRKVAEGFFTAGQLRLAFLRGTRGDVASAFQIEYDGALLLYNSGYDPGFGGGGMSPGLVLLARCLEDAIRRGLREFDFLRGRERYKYDLGGRDRIVYRAVLGLPVR